MLLKITKREADRLIQALNLACDYQESLIEAHRIAFQQKPNAGILPRVVPPEYRNDVRRWQRDIDAFRKLRNKLRSYFHQ